MKNNSHGMIYVHTPFCARKCDYCDFASFVRDEYVIDSYFDALNKEVDIKRESAGNFSVDSLFFGGGTPSYVNPRYISELIMNLSGKFSFAKNAEITIEMNPNSVTKDKLNVYKNAGINRISIGLQSTDNEELKTLSRLHTYEEFLQAYDLVRKTGFDNVNIDIMSAIPGQSVGSYLKTLERIIKLAPEHISAYSLIVEQGTPYYDKYADGRGLPSEDEDRLMYHETKRILESAGYLRYEISNYAKEGYECRHNVGYWERKPYLGLGLAAASLIDETRYQMHGNLEDYISGDFSEEVTALSDNDRMEEFMFLGLRLTAGISEQKFEKTFGKKIEEVYITPIIKLEKQGLLKRIDGKVFLTDKGLDLANYCMSEFIFG